MVDSGEESGVMIDSQAKNAEFGARSDFWRSGTPVVSVLPAAHVLTDRLETQACLL